MPDTAVLFPLNLTPPDQIQRSSFPPFAAHSPGNISLPRPYQWVSISLPTSVALMRSSSIEDYLKAVYKLEEQGGAPVSTGALAESMDVASASASNMIKRLGELDFLTYEAYEGATLTDPGRTVALE